MSTAREVKSVNMDIRYTVRSENTCPNILLECAQFVLFFFSFFYLIDTIR